MDVSVNAETMLKAMRIASCAKLDDESRHFVDFLSAPLTLAAY
jgi:hypothetical protein